MDAEPNYETCPHDGKICHRHYKAALAAVKRHDHAMLKMERGDDRRWIRPYRCRTCGQWHLGNEDLDRGNLVKKYNQSRKRQRRDDDAE